LLTALDYPPKFLDLADWRTRMNAMQEKQLCAIERAETSEVALIQEGFTNCPVRLCGDPPNSLIGIPVRTQHVRPKMPNNGVLRRRRDKLNNRQSIPDRIMIISSEHGAYFKARPAAPAPTPRVDLPGAVHLEMGVQGEVVAEPEQLMLAP
jgi:hypothetical protein